MCRCTHDRVCKDGVLRIRNFDTFTFNKTNSIVTVSLQYATVTGTGRRHKGELRNRVRGGTGLKNE